jgi:hypothetical protein
MYFNSTCHIYITLCIWFGNIETLLILFMYFNSTCYIYITLCIWYGNFETLLMYCLCTSTALVISTLHCAYDPATLKHFLCTVYDCCVLAVGYFVQECEWVSRKWPYFVHCKLCDIMIVVCWQLDTLGRSLSGSAGSDGTVYTVNYVTLWLLYVVSWAVFAGV